MELKTLKDFKNAIVLTEMSEPDRLNGTLDFKGKAKADLNMIENFSAISDSFLIHSELLKAEAIKWIKGCTNNENMTTHNMCGFYYDEDKKHIKVIPVFCCCCERFIEFFNLSEEDLK